MVAPPQSRNSIAGTHETTVGRRSRFSSATHGLGTSEFAASCSDTSPAMSLQGHASWPPEESPIKQIESTTHEYRPRASAMNEGDHPSMFPSPGAGPKIVAGAKRSIRVSNNRSGLTPIRQRSDRPQTFYRAFPTPGRSPDPPDGILPHPGNEKQHVPTYRNES